MTIHNTTHAPLKNYRVIQSKSGRFWAQKRFLWIFWRDIRDSGYYSLDDAAKECHNQKILDETPRTRLVWGGK